MGKTLLVRLSGVALLCAGAWVAFTQNPPAPPANRLEKVKDDLYAIIGDGGNTAVYLTDEGVILIDDKFERDAADIMEKVKSVTDKPVKYVLNTHHHGDHTGGNAKLLAGTPQPQLIAHANARANMVKGKMPGIPPLAFTDESGVYLGGKGVVAKYFGRGHTNGDVAVYFPALRVVHTGDLFVSKGFQQLIDYNGGGSAMEWTQTLDRLLAAGWDFDVVIPGHGPVATKAELIKFRADFESWRNRISGLVRDGKSKDDVTKVLVSEFGWTPNGNPMRAVDGLMTELKR